MAATKPWDYHLELGARLAPLRRDGLLIVGSGNVAHNLRKVRPGMADTGFDWAQRFDEDARAIMLDEPDEVAELTGHPDFAVAAPTPDHFIPLLYLAGLAGVAARPADILVDGYAAGSLSMTAYTLDASCEATGGTSPAAPLPEGVDPEDMSRSLPGNSRSSANALMMPRYASRSNMRRHHHVITNDDGQSGRMATGPRSDPRPKWSLTSADVMFGRYRVAVAAPRRAAPIARGEAGSGPGRPPAPRLATVRAGPAPTGSWPQ